MCEEREREIEAASNKTHKSKGNFIASAESKREAISALAKGGGGEAATDCCTECKKALRCYLRRLIDNWKEKKYIRKIFFTMLCDAAGRIVYTG